MNLEPDQKLTGAGSSLLKASSNTDSELVAAKFQRLVRLYAFASGVTEIIFRFQNPQELYEKACRIAVEQCGFIMACVGLAESGTDLLQLVAHAGKEDGYLASVQISVRPGQLGFGPCGRAYREERVACSNDVATDPDVQPWREEALRRGYRSIAAVPLKMAGRPIGVFAVYAGQPDGFATEELQLLEALGGNLSFAIESHQNDQLRVRAETALRDSNWKLKLLAARLQSLQEEERTRIAREIHDELGQLLTGLTMDLHWIERDLEGQDDPRLNPILDRAVAAAELTDTLAGSIQRIAAELRPAILDRLGLVMALAHEAEQFQQRTGLRCRFKLPEKEQPIPLESATAVFRMSQEAMNNVVRHAQATELDIELQYHPVSLSLVVRDNGRGIQPEDLIRTNSLGVLGMQERARQLGGDITFSSGKSGGTVVTLRIPLPEECLSPCSE